MALKTKICLTPFRRSLFLFSYGVIHFALRFLYSLDFFGSFLGQAKNEQEGTKVKMAPQQLDNGFNGLISAY